MARWLGFSSLVTNDYHEFIVVCSIIHRKMVIVVGRELHGDGFTIAIVATTIAIDFSFEFLARCKIRHSEGR